MDHSEDHEEYDSGVEHRTGFERRKGLSFWERNHPALIGLVGALGGGMLGFGGQVYLSENQQEIASEAAKLGLQEARENLAVELNRELASQLEAYRIVIDRQAVQIRELNQKVGFQEAELIRLKLTVESATGNPRANLIRLLDAFRNRPAWAKTCNEETEVCVNVHANDAYEARYCITANRYRGKTDFEVWDEDIARQFHENDLAVLQSRDTRDYEELVYDCVLDRRVTYQFTKFHVELTDGTHIIGGLQISNEPVSALRPE